MLIGEGVMTTLSIHQVVDGQTLIAIEFTDGKQFWFYDFDQEKWPGMRLGCVPRKSLDEEYERILVTSFMVSADLLVGDSAPPPGGHTHNVAERE